jgi:hypothetical protein
MRTVALEYNAKLAAGLVTRRVRGRQIDLARLV